METLRWRDPLEFGDLLIGLLRDPIRYHVRSVGGAGLAGSLTVRGSAVSLERIYAPPPPPNISIVPGDRVTFDAKGLPTIFRHTDETDLPFVWLCKGYMFPSGAIIPPHVGVQIQLGAMWVENWKAAHSAQRQLDDDAAAIEFANDLRARHQRGKLSTCSADAWASGSRSIARPAVDGGSRGSAKLSLSAGSD